MAHQWQGVIEEYKQRLPVTDQQKVITLREGGTPLLKSYKLSDKTDAEVYIKYEGMNPTGSFKDRGMTMAVTDAINDGANAVVCASTGNTSASAAAYARCADIKCIVLVPEGKISMGKLSQAIAYGAEIVQVDGNFDNCLTIARQLADNYPVFLVNSVNPARIQGQKTASFEVVDVLGDAPDIHLLPVGNAGNISAYWKGYVEYSKPYTNNNGLILDAKSTKTPQMWGFQAAGAAPFVSGAPVENPDTIATAIRIGNPASWDLAIDARDTSGGLIEAVTDQEILAAHRFLSSEEGIFVEPASAASIAGLFKKIEEGVNFQGKTIVATVTGHGLKDPQWALESPDGQEISPQKVPFDVDQVAHALNLSS